MKIHEIYENSLKSMKLLRLSKIRSGIVGEMMKNWESDLVYSENWEFLKKSERKI